VRSISAARGAIRPGERVHGVAQRVDVFAEHEVQAGQVAHLRLLGVGATVGPRSSEPGRRLSGKKKGGASGSSGAARQFN
jgi:hypothetical protein